MSAQPVSPQAADLSTPLGHPKQAPAGSLGGEIPAEIARGFFSPESRWFDELRDAIADALLSEREKATKAEREASEHRVKDFWQQWARKRLEIQREHWLRAAKSALSGDMRDLRNRVELAEAPPIELVLSEGS